MKLNKLLKNVDFNNNCNFDENLEIKNITCNSKNITFASLVTLIT